MECSPRGSRVQVSSTLGGTVRSYRSIFRSIKSGGQRRARVGASVLLAVFLAELLVPAQTVPVGAFSNPENLRSLLANGDFEQDRRPWVGGTVLADSTAPSGEFALRLCAPRGDCAGSTRQTIRVPRGVTQEWAKLTFWYWGWGDCYGDCLTVSVGDGCCSRHNVQRTIGRWYMDGHWRRAEIDLTEHLWYHRSRSIDIAFTGDDAWDMDLLIDKVRLLAIAEGDSDPPSVPVISSASHSPGSSSPSRRVRANWSPSEDLDSGVAGYSFSWSSGGASLPDEVVDTSIDQARTVLSTYLPDPSVWFFNVRAVDAVGNWSATSSFGPLVIDSSGVRDVAGTWWRHGMSFAIKSDGSGTARWRTYRWCSEYAQPCDSMRGNRIISGGRGVLEIVDVDFGKPNRLVARMLSSSDRRTFRSGELVILKRIQHERVVLKRRRDGRTVVFCSLGTPPEHADPCGA